MRILVEKSLSCPAPLITQMNYSPFISNNIWLLNTSITVSFQRENYPDAYGLFSFSMKAESIRYSPRDCYSLNAKIPYISAFLKRFSCNFCWFKIYISMWDTFNGFLYCISIVFKYEYIFIHAYNIWCILNWYWCLSWGKIFL